MEWKAIQFKKESQNVMTVVQILSFSGPERSVFTSNKAYMHSSETFQILPVIVYGPVACLNAITD